ncbi:hypothetical protein [Bacillus sp. CBEL-1]|uniref:hypothetical protein n=1 Tax=Bacillus sp. CBEL-1 TaxID=2502980 RepID=UPI00104E098B|nr:hypothetical protein [Bacillus sp. CBEL-1]TDB53758.1 hypothetical protein EPL02_05055 [Bacillus sp. CBEL-1]
MISKWLKWKLFIRWKNQWNYIKIFRDLSVGRSLWVLFFIQNIIHSCFIFFGTYFLLKYVVLNEQLTNGEVKQSLVLNLILKMLSSIQQNGEILWSILFCLIMIFAFISGISSSKWQIQSKDQEWLMITLKIKQRKANIFLYLESIVWDTKDFIFNYIPILVAVGAVTGVNKVYLASLLILTLGSYLLMTLLVSILHNNYIKLQHYKWNFFLRLLTNLIVRLLIVYTAFFIGKVSSPWIKKFPLTSNNINYAHYNEWINEGVDVIFSILAPLSKIFLHPYMPYNVFSDILFDGLQLHALMKLAMFFVGLIVLLFILSKMNHHRRTPYYPFKRIEAFNTFLAKVIPGTSYTTILAKHHYRTNYLRYRFPIVLGSFLFWVIWGVITGLLQSLNPSEEIYFLIMSFYLFFLTYFYVYSIFSELNGMFSVDGEGKQVITYLLNGKSLWDVFKYRFHLFALTSLPLFIVADIVFFFVNQMSLILSIMTLLLHIISFFFFALLMFLPGVLRPHFNYENIEQLDDYPDKKIVADVIRFGTVGLMVPLLMLPTALFLVDSIGTLSYLVIQWGMIGIILLLFVGTALSLVSKLLVKKSSFEQINL